MLTWLACPGAEFVGRPPRYASHVVLQFNGGVYSVVGCPSVPYFWAQGQGYSPVRCNPGVMQPFQVQSRLKSIIWSSDQPGTAADVTVLSSLFVRRFRSMGSCALNMCLVASGAADVYHEAGIHVWDMAAGAVLVTEAGGTVTDTAGTCCTSAPMPHHLCFRNLGTIIFITNLGTAHGDVLPAAELWSADGLPAPAWLAAASSNGKIQLSYPGLLIQHGLPIFQMCPLLSVASQAACFSLRRTASAILRVLYVHVL